MSDAVSVRGSHLSLEPSTEAVKRLTVEAGKYLGRSSGESIPTDELRLQAQAEGYSEGEIDQLLANAGVHSSKQITIPEQGDLFGDLWKPSGVPEDPEPTDGSESEMHEYVNDQLGTEFTERHANMNAMAGWLLGFAHRETPTEVNGRSVQRWGLTRDGVRYLRFHEDNKTGRARDHLINSVRDVEIIQRMHRRLDSAGELTLDEVREMLDSETGISGASVERRASTVVKWLTLLPDVEERSDGRSKKFLRV